MATFNFLSSLLGARKQSAAVSGLQGLQQPKVPPLLQGGALGGGTPPNIPPAPQMPQGGQVNPQIAAIQGQLGGLRTTAEGIQSGLATKAQSEQQAQDVGARFRPFIGSIESAMTPSSEEDQLQMKLANLLSARDKGLIQSEEQAVPLQAILGEQGRIEKRALAGAIPLTEQLALLQARRQSALDVSKEKYGIEKDIYGFEKSQREEARPDEEKVDEFTNEEGQRVVAFRDKKTGKVRQEVLGTEQVKTSEGEINRQRVSGAITKARQEIMNARNRGDLEETYLRLRGDFGEAIGDVTVFDRVFAPFLPKEVRDKLGVGKASAVNILGGLDLGSELENILNKR